ncbi:hypothetical protein U8607_21925 [Methylobacterium durans]|uniref:DUF6894 family protein n=1 Tax=Methylobacterium durans TaxID=2202825 RepID=UPI002AFE8BEB|nr:hypothetical protein [Methylobacterium durans]MEA1834757.1 hypothetical protein [Methylobacterium durans]
MPRYHFHLRTIDGLQWDPDGLPFDNLEDAYLDVCRGIQTIAGDLARAGTNRSSLLRYAFEISDAEGGFLMEVPFAEVLAPDRKLRRPSPVLDQKVRTEMERTRRLIASVGQERDALHTTLVETYALLARLRALDMGGRGPRQA